MDGAAFTFPLLLVFVVGFVVGRDSHAIIRRLQHMLEGGRPDPPRRQERHLRVIRGAPRPLPRGDCDLFNWQGGDDAA